MGECREGAESCREGPEKPASKASTPSRGSPSRAGRARSSGGRQPCRRRWSGCSSSGRCGSESRGRTAARCPGGSTCRAPATPLARRPRERPCRRFPLLLERAGQVRAQHLLRRARRRKLLRLGQHPVAAQPCRADKPPPAVTRLVRPERAAGAASVEGGLDGRRRLVAVKAECFRIAVPQADRCRLLILPSVSVDPEAAERRCLGGGGHRQKQEDRRPARALARTSRGVGVAFRASGLPHR